MIQMIQNLGMDSELCIKMIHITLRILQKQKLHSIQIKKSKAIGCKYTKNIYTYIHILHRNILHYSNG